MSYSMDFKMGSEDLEEWLCSVDDVQWDKLPQDLLEEALAWLPADSLPIYRRVSKEWNALLSSSRFLGDLWLDKPINRKPWLVLWHQHSRQPCQVYCFYRKRWEPSLFLSFMSRDNENFWRGSVLANSGSGRLMVQMCDPLSGFSYHLCNPYTQTSIKLPPMPSIERVFSRVIVEGEVAINDNKNGLEIFNVVALQLAVGRRTCIVQLYDSSVKSWRTVAHVPQNLDARYQMIFSNGYFYCLVIERSLAVTTHRILIFRIQDGGELRMWVEPMPEILVDSARQMFNLVTCGSRLLMVSAEIEAGGLVIIWEFNKNFSNTSWHWKEIVRMPASLRLQLNFDAGIRCEGVEDCICFISVRGTDAVKVLVYNLNEKSWNWIPSCPLKVENDKEICSMAFQARPDVKVG